MDIIDRFSTTLASGYTAGGTALTLNSNVGLPSGLCDFYLLILAEGTNTEEVFHVTSMSGVAATVAGAQANTTASNHASGAQVIASIWTKAAFQQLDVRNTTQSANRIFAGPGSGSPAAPAFRSLVAADLPNPGASSLGGVQSKASASHQFLTQIGTDGSVTAAQPADADIAFSDVTTGNVSTTKHGYAPKLPNDASKFFDGTGAYSTPAGGGTVTHSSGALTSNAPVLGNGSGDIKVGTTAQLVPSLPSDASKYLDGTGAWSAPKRGIVFVFDGGGSALSTGKTIYLRIPFACTLQDWSIESTTAETVTVKFWRVATGGSALPTSSNSISTSGVSLASGTAVFSTTMSDFTSVAIAANDLIACTITAVTASQQVTVTLGAQ